MSKLTVKAMHKVVEIEGYERHAAGSKAVVIAVFRDALDSLIDSLVVARDHIDRSIEPREIKW